MRKILHCRVFRAILAVKVEDVNCESGPAVRSYLLPNRPLRPAAYDVGSVINLGGVTIDDCEAVSREFSPMLDEKNFIDDVYTMEVSSPGLGRPLRRERDYEKSVGRELEIHTYKAVDGDKIFFGILTAYDRDTVTIREENGNERTFRRPDLSMIRLAFDF